MSIFQGERLDDMFLSIYSNLPGMYARFASITSINWSTVISSRTIISAQLILYSLQTNRATSAFNPFVCFTISWRPIPPDSFLINLTSGGYILVSIRVKIESELQRNSNTFNFNDKLMNRTNKLCVIMVRQWITNRLIYSNSKWKKFLFDNFFVSYWFCSVKNN